MKLVNHRFDMFFKFFVNKLNIIFVGRSIETFQFFAQHTLEIALYWEVKLQQVTILHIQYGVQSDSLVEVRIH